MGDRGLLRHPDRLGQGHQRRLPAGGRRGRADPRRQEPADALLRAPVRGHGAAPTSSTPRSCAAPPSRRRARSAGASSPRAPSSCPTRSPTGSRSASPTPPWTGSSRSTTSASSPTSTTSCSAISRRHLRTELDLVVTAQQVRSYKPEPAHFKECARRIGKKKGWVHITSGHYTDVEPLIKMRVPVIWINRRGQKLESSRQEADDRGQEPPGRGQEARLLRRAPPRRAGGPLRPE